MWTSKSVKTQKHTKYQSSASFPPKVTLLSLSFIEWYFLDFCGLSFKEDNFLDFFGLSFKEGYILEFCGLSFMEGYFLDCCGLSFNPDITWSSGGIQLGFPHQKCTLECPIPIIFSTYENSYFWKKLGKSTFYEGKLGPPFVRGPPKFN